MSRLRDEVVITNIGLETCVGRDEASFWSALAGGRSGISPIDAFDVEDLPCRVAGQVDFDPSEVLSATDRRRTSVFQQYLLSVVTKALEGVEFNKTDKVGLIVGTGGGGIPHLAETFSTDPERYVGGRWATWDPFLIMKSLSNMGAGYVAIRHGLTGPALTVTTACASGCDALGLGTRLLRSGELDFAIVAAVDVWVTRDLLSAFSRIKALSTRSPEEATFASRPFDLNRDGMVPSDGAAAVLLESPRTASGAGRRIVASVRGVASTCDAHHMVAPRDDGLVAAAAVTGAINDAGVSPVDIEHVNAHGTSTPANDVAETKALRVAFGDHADSLVVNAPKSMLGHSSGASGLIEAIALGLSISNSYVPPTINLTVPDPQCDLDYTAGVGRELSIEYGLTCSFGFGGQNSAAVLARWHG